MRIVIRVVSVSQEHEVKEFVERVRYEDLLVRWLDRIYSIRSEIYNITYPRDHYLAVKRYADHVRTLYLMLLPPMKKVVRERVGEALKDLYVDVEMITDVSGEIQIVLLSHPRVLVEELEEEIEENIGDVEDLTSEERVRLLWEAINKMRRRYSDEQRAWREIIKYSAKSCGILLESADVVLEAIVDVLYESGYLTERERVPVGMME